MRAVMAWGQLAMFDDSVARMPTVSWLPDPGSNAARLLVVAWLVAAVSLASGRRVGLAGPLGGLAVLAFLLLDHQTYANHLYLMALLLVLFGVADAGAAFGGDDERDVLHWPIRLIQAQIVLVYAFSAFTKLNDGFLSGEVLAGVLRDGLVTVPAGLLRPTVMAPLAIVAVAAELTIAFFIWRPRTFSVAILIGTTLHGSIALLMNPTSDLIVFGIMMLSTYPLFLPIEPIDVAASPAVERLRRRDVMRQVRSHTRDTSGVPSSRPTGAAAVQATRERIVPDLWVAGVWRLPGLGTLAGRRWNDE